VRTARGIPKTMKIVLACLVCLGVIGAVVLLVQRLVT
jgi:hypothetical protein